MNFTLTRWLKLEFDLKILQLTWFSNQIRLIFLFQNKRDASSSTGGALILGGTDSSYYTGSLYYTPISAQTYWQFKLTGITINGQTITSNVNAIADTGTTLIVGPYSAIRAINNFIGATRYGYSSTWYLSSCSLRASMPSKQMVIVLYIFFL